MSIKFKEGKKYVTRSGDIMELMGISRHLLFFKECGGRIIPLYLNGLMYNATLKTEFDIVAEHEQKEEQKPKQRLPTVKDILNDLPDPYRRWAFANIEKQNLDDMLLEIGIDLKSAVGLFDCRIAEYPKYTRCIRDMCLFWNKVAEGEFPPIPKKQEEITNEKYNRTIKDRTGKKLGIVDVYCVGDAFGVDSIPLNHALKKILCAGTRGKGDEAQDLEEAIQAIQRRLMEIKK